jgi:hypothetical protein
MIEMNSSRSAYYSSNSGKRLNDGYDLSFIYTTYIYPLEYY